MNLAPAYGVRPACWRFLAAKIPRSCRRSFRSRPSTLHPPPSPLDPPMASKSSFLDKVLGRLSRLDAEGVQTVVQRLARERSFLETLFNTIEDGVLVVDEAGRILYFNQAVTQYLGLQANVEGQPVIDFIPELGWEKIARFDTEGGQRVVRHEFEVHFPRSRFLRLYAAPLDGQAAGSSGMALILHD